MDIKSKKQRSFNMSQIKSRNTKPELRLRKILYTSGIKGYRLSCDLPGKPDIVFPRKKVAVFVDGCQWHKCPKHFVRPKSNVAFWDKKLSGNVARDTRINKQLRTKGWRILRVWEHELKNKNLNKHTSRIVKKLKEVV